MMTEQQPIQESFLEPPAPRPIETFDKVLELERDINARKQCYPKLVERRKLDPAVGDRRIAIMESILADINAQLAREVAEVRPLPPRDPS